MRKFLLLIAPWCCLLLSASPTKAQVANPLALPFLPAQLVQLDSGTVIHRKLIGFTPTAYQALRENLAIGEQLLLVRAGDLVALRAIHRLDSISLAARSGEIQRLRGEVSKRDAQLTAQEAREEKILSRPLQKPMLLDVNFYKGFGAGYLAGLFTTLRFNR